MGWSTGSSIMGDIIEQLNDNDVDEITRKRFYDILIPIFENYDCDTLYELAGEDDAFDESYKECNPEEFNDDELFDE